MTMRFGLFVPQGWRMDLTDIAPDQQWDAMNKVAQLADADERWESIWVYDHFHTVPEPTQEATHEAWTLMAAFAAATKRVRLGQMCTCMSYRNPAYLAKVAATVDIVSKGRIEMGIGAGWYEHEWRAYGYGFPDAPARLRMLREGVEIFKQAWATGTATLDGEFYQVDGARVYPKPLQQPGIPMWIAGGGEKVTLKIAAQYASYTNFDGTPEGFAHKSEVLKGHCDKLGRPFDEIVRSSNYNVMIGRDEAELAERKRVLAERLGRYLSPAKAESAVGEYHPGSIGYGTPEQIVEKLSKVKELGLGYTIVYFPEAAYDTSGIELFANEVIPALQG